MYDNIIAILNTLLIVQLDRKKEDVESLNFLVFNGLDNRELRFLIFCNNLMVSKLHFGKFYHFYCTHKTIKIDAPY